MIALPSAAEHVELIDASIDELWELVSNSNNVSRWHPDVVDSQIEYGSGRDVGTVRAIRLRDRTPADRARRGMACYDAAARLRVHAEEGKDE